jgi:hypothetical protein
MLTWASFGGSDGLFNLAAGTQQEEICFDLVDRYEHHSQEDRQGFGRECTWVDHLYPAMDARHASVCCSNISLSCSCPEALGLCNHASLYPRLHINAGIISMAASRIR